MKFEIIMAIVIWAVAIVGIIVMKKITIRRQAIPGMGHIRGDAVLNLRVA